MRRLTAAAGRFAGQFRRRIVVWCVFAFLFSILGSVSIAAEPTRDELEQQFVKVVVPFVKNYCVDCHGPDRQEAKLNLSDDVTVDVVTKNLKVWEIVSTRLVARDMPPEDASKQPADGARHSVIKWIEDWNDFEARRNAGDPGEVLARRLSNAEYDNTIRDLIGHDIKPTREFPVDPANEAGFDNSGESLTMSPALVKKYLAAARAVADHAVLTPNGFVFARHLAVTETDRDKFCVQQIVDFYQRHDVDYADYFYALWRYEHRNELGLPAASLSDFAMEPVRAWHRAADANNHHKPRRRLPLSAKYLAILEAALTTPESAGPLGDLQQQWKQFSSTAVPLPASNPTSPVNGKQQSGMVRPEAWEIPVYRECERLRDLTIKLRQSLDKPIEKLKVKGIADGTQPLVLWWNSKIAANRMSYLGKSDDAALDEATRRFCRIFPNAFAMTSRSHHSDPKLGVNVRLLSAGFHLMQGYFRDDQPLRELLLSDAENERLDFLWQQLNFVTLVPIRQYKDYLFFERAEPPQFADGLEFDFVRPENNDVTLQVNLDRMRDTYLQKLEKLKPSPEGIDAINKYFADMSTEFRWIEKTQLDAQPTHLKSLVDFARRAYRRPLSDDEEKELVAFYQSLRQNDGLSHEDAIRDSIASVLMSPHFCYRLDLTSSDAKVKRLSDYELASRLSYFQWSSMPDEILLESAGRGELHKPEALRAQVRRMLKDSRIRGLATEFAGNWLDIRRFEEHNGVDRERFPAFTNELRRAMFEEPIRLFIDVASHNRSILELIDTDDTFVNAALANHYGVSIEGIEPLDVDATDPWYRVTGVNKNDRGGLLAMSAFLTKSSPGLRTSPVKRGYWVVKRLLGEHIPAPPPDVPELPKDEAQLGDLTLAQVLSKHRDHKACAGCHQKFDSIGLVFEGFGPTGELRKTDFGGRTVNQTATFPDGAERTGVDGLRKYLLETRRDEFVTNFCRKLLAYSLGRSLLPTDKLTIDAMKQNLREHDYRFENLIETIVTSPQFLNKRGVSGLPVAGESL